jgi:hypothetical protein
LKFKSVPKKKKRGDISNISNQKKKKEILRPFLKKEKRGDINNVSNQKKRKKPTKKSTYLLTLKSRSKFKTISKKKRENVSNVPKPKKK